LPKVTRRGGTHRKYNRPEEEETHPDTQENETRVETMRAGLAIRQEAEGWLRPGEGNEQ